MGHTTPFAFHDMPVITPHHLLSCSQANEYKFGRELSMILTLGVHLCRDCPAADQKSGVCAIWGHHNQQTAGFGQGGEKVQ